jgi:predicted nuclease of predicted toxin-antitoxin system
LRFLLDESADHRLTAFLVQRGHEVTAVAHDYPGSLSDRSVLAIARQERRILITNDADFGNLIVRDRLTHRGVILFRLRTTRLAAKVERLDFVLRRYGERLEEFLVVTDARVRVHRPRQR